MFNMAIHYSVKVLTSMVFIVCTLSVSVSQDVTLSISSGGSVVTDPVTTVSSTSRTEVYLDPTSTHGSPLNLSVVIDVRSSFELSFRTCLYGSLLSQIGGDQRNYFQLILEESGSLNISLSSAAASSSVLLGRNLNDNQWYKFMWTYQDLKNVTVSVQRYSTLLYEKSVTFSQDLRNVNLLNGSKLCVGDGLFEGCLRDGPQMWFLSAAEVDDTAVQWHGCRNETVCDHIVNSCSSSPCANNGSCVAGVNNFTCLCLPDFTDPICSTRVSECSSQPCQNGATCVELESTFPSRNYMCMCPHGFTGVDCEVEFDECVLKNCTVCVDGICQCPTGFTGTNCSEQSNRCRSNPCQNRGTCINGIGNYSCQCESAVVDLTEHRGSVYTVGYNGTHCETVIDACQYEPSICLNGGKCELDDKQLHGFVCYCKNVGRLLISGRYCERHSTYCEFAGNEGCLNGATCVNQDDGYVCQCAAGFAGLNCSVNINECESDPCQYNGTCTDLVNGYHCGCIAGITGTNCETNIDDCRSLPCLNEGHCIDLINGYLCDCSATGFVGVTCEVEIDECESFPCHHNATCIDRLLNYTCVCHTGYAGFNCEVDVDECQSLPCQNNATCWQRSDQSRRDFSYATASGFDCLCAAGFTGTTCETNIDECASSPCENGRCVDRVNMFECQCAAGFTGLLCAREIDECKQPSSPCANNATCVDLIADYHCACVDVWMSGNLVQYGGRNCTVKLTGCERNECASGGSCRPVLVDEFSNNHSYLCDCLPGFHGDLCNKTTAVSFDSRDAWIRHRISVVENTSISFQFRTTLPGGSLIFITFASVDEYLSVNLVSGNQLQLEHNGNGGLQKNVIGAKTMMKLNDAEWHQLNIEFGSEYVSVTFHHDDCSNDTVCSSLLTVDGSAAMTYFGSTAADVRSHEGFVGCMQDIRVNSDLLTPSWLAAMWNASANVTGSCDWNNNCEPDPCNGRGTCSDWWTHSTCHCTSPFWGLTCSQEYVAATFGRNGVSPSYAQFAGRRSVSDDLANYINVSFLVRTHQQSGLILFVGANASVPVSSQTFMTIELSQVGVVVKISAGDEIQTNVLPGFVADGTQHFVYVSRNYSLLQIQLDNMSEVYDVNFSLPLFPDVLYVGGMPLNTTRHRRDTYSYIRQFSGTLQDVRVNGVLLQPFPLNNTGEDGTPASNIELPEDKLNVDVGEQSDDVCQLLQPCENNATCHTEFYNKYRCSCTDEFRGVNCSEPNFCSLYSCPLLSQCRNLKDGYECGVDATFNGQSSVIQYSNTILNSSQQPVITFSLRLRTRDFNATILYLWHTVSNWFLSIQLADGKLQIVHQFGASLWWNTDAFVADGIWHEVTVTYSHNRTSLIVDSSSVGDQPVVENSLRNFVDSSCTVIIGTDAEHSSSFKGCLDEVRINSLLLPFFTRAELVNDTSTDRFDVVQMTDVEVGCHSDDVCASTAVCLNNGTCRDVWNAHMCDCAAGFNGTLCEVNIDECAAGNECDNGATCVDGIASYSCICAAGFTGLRCVKDIDECVSMPCQHDGVCIDRINRYECNCSTNYTGLSCEFDLRENCAAQPCQNNATCISVPTGYLDVELFNCSCVAGYVGRYCEHLLDLCNGSDCRNGATCTPVYDILSYSCLCSPGYTDTHCETEINECLSDPCQGRGNCTDLLNSFNCSCNSGWTGEYCETNVDECASSESNLLPLCHHGGVCADTPGSYRCICLSTGYTGRHCDEDIDECVINSTMCLNGASCTNTPGSFFCACADGYVGRFCSLEDECYVDDGYCSNNGKCNVSVGKNDTAQYLCRCHDGWTGQRCQEALMHRGVSSADIALIVGLILGIYLLFAVILIVAVVARQKHSGRGTYSPSRQEMVGSRIDFASILKVPPEERLI